MDIENINVQQIKITAGAGKALYNGVVYAKTVYLASEEDKGKWREVDEADTTTDNDTVLDTTTLAGIKAQKIAEINAADEASNSFTANSVQMWIDKETRTSLMSNTLPALKAAGEKTTKLWGEENGVPVSFEVNIDTMLNVMLPALELYCKATYDLCMQHKATVLAMSDIESVQAFDAAAGYPGKLKF